MKYLRRLVWYIASRLMILTIVLGLMTIAFYFSMNASNIFIILKDGMAKRAQVVMMDEDEAVLGNYFSASYLRGDPVLAAARNNTNPYDRYSVTGMDHRLTMEWMWSWPWEDTARATVVESIPAVDGRILGSYKAVLPEDQWPVPRWQSGRYDVMLTRENGRWRIRNMTLLKQLDMP
ncbi:MAG: hypothetical protein PHQ85_08110 [Eubacteriales bacterium]|jgi:hypothetical protein|nr:hypothetical protein [Eubacteriales bacterium]MDD4105905.1 hypothetical protein [Eubacteriales bacterium]